MLCAITYVIMAVGRIPVVLFLKYDPSDVIVTLGGLIWGPMTFSASYCRRILFIKDGKIFHELNRGTDSRKEFFSKILEVVSVLGGEQNDLL